MEFPDALSAGTVQQRRREAGSMRRRLLIGPVFFIDVVSSMKKGSRG
jgi:hypothetical protein